MSSPLELIHLIAVGDEEVRIDSRLLQLVVASQVLTQMVRADETVQVPVTIGAVEWATRLCCAASPLSQDPLSSVTMMVESPDMMIEGVIPGKSLAAETGRLGGIRGTAMFIVRDGGGQ